MKLTRLIGQSFGAPIAHFRSAVRIFWPAWSAAALFILAIEFWARTPDAESFGRALWFTAFVIWFALTVSALVRWHRLLLLGEAPSTANFLLTSNEFAFLRRYLIIGLIGIILMAIAIPTAVFTASFALAAGAPDFEQAIAWKHHAVMVAAIAGPLILTAWLIPNMCLRLPALALAERGENTPRLTVWSPARWKLAAGIAITTTAVTVLTGLYAIATDLAALSTDWDNGPSPGWVLGVVLSVMELTLTPMVFAAFLSFAYKEIIDQPSNIAP